jgi:hypothetical protein
LEIYYALSIILFSRLFFYFSETPINRKQFFTKIVLAVLPLLVLKLSFILGVFIILLILVSSIFYKIEKKISSDKINNSRFFELIIILILTGVGFSSRAAIEFNNSTVEFISSLSNYFAFFEFFKSGNWFNIWVFVFGGLLLMNELNIFIRIIFKKFNLVPQNYSNESDINNSNKEYNAGRMIGILERIIIYCLIFIDQYEAIGLIIAAKAFARFKAMDERIFAEYVLIGTLLSATLSFIVALWVKYLVIG